MVNRHKDRFVDALLAPKSQGLYTSLHVTKRPKKINFLAADKHRFAQKKKQNDEKISENPCISVANTKFCFHFKEDEAIPIY